MKNAEQRPDRAFDQSLPPNVRITSQKLDDLEAAWERGRLVIIERLNGWLARNFPSFRPAWDPSLPRQLLRKNGPGLSYHYSIFCAVLPAPLLTSVPTCVRLVRGRKNKKFGSIALRDRERILPWSIGLTALGIEGKDLDAHYLEIVRDLRSAARNATWLDKYVIRPTNGQAAVWRLIFKSWRTRLAQTDLEPPESLTQAQRDIWLALWNNGRRMTATAINAALGKRGLPQSPGMLGQRLADMVRNKHLTNRTDTNPRGYGLPHWD